MRDAGRIIGRLECSERGCVKEERGAAAGLSEEISLLTDGGQLAESQKHRPVCAGKALQIVLEFALVRCGAQIDEAARCAGSAGPFQDHVGDVGVVEELGLGDGGTGSMRRRCRATMSLTRVNIIRSSGSSMAWEIDCSTMFTTSPLCV
jgi:hypothetical protein